MDKHRFLKLKEEIITVASINQESETTRPKHPEKELVLIAFGYHLGPSVIVWCNDGFIRSEMVDGGLCAIEVAEFLIDKDAPDHGIWVWEGRVKWVEGGNWEHLESPEPEYRTIQWRHPDDDEWDAIKEQRNPFEPKPRVDFECHECWGPKISL